MTEVEIRYPTEGSESAGRYIEDNGDQFLVLSWWHWNGEDFAGILSTWLVSDWDIQLHEVFVKEKGSEWKRVEGENIGAWIPDRHKRIARELGRDKFKLTQFYRLKL